MRNLWIALAFMVALLGGSIVAKDLLFSGAAVSYASVEQVTLVKINEQRTARGLKPLVVNAALTKLARDHSNAMLRMGYFSHAGFETRATIAHRSLFAENLYIRGSENGIAIVNSSNIVTTWMNSPPHRRDILLEAARRAGIGIVVGTYLGHKNVTLVTADFSS